MKPCFQYHHDTGDYMGPEIADEDPLNPGEYLLPANCTFVRPECLMPQLDGEKWVNNIQYLAKLERSRRNVKLAACDWCVLPDTPLTAAQVLEVMDYRKLLRAVPQQINFPVDVIWPKLPIFVAAN